MVLYACASCLLGWSGMSWLAQEALDVRGLAGTISRMLRVLIALVCAVGALAAWMLLDTTISCLAFSFGCACMAALLACDLRERVLPTEIVGALLAFAVVFRLIEGGVSELAAAGIPAALIAGILLVLNTLRAHRGASELIGSGDVRMILPLALFSGTQGLAYGLFACALLMGAIAILQIMLGRAERHTQIALAPGLAAWLFAGTLVPFL